MHRPFRAPAAGIGTKLTAAFGAVVGLTLLVLALALLAGREATRGIRATEAVSAPASLAAGKAQDALLRMQLHLRGYLVLSDVQDIGQYDQARTGFEKALDALQTLTPAWDPDDQRRVRSLTEVYARWKRLPPRLFELHEDALRNRPALRLSRIDVQARRVRVLAESEAMIALQKARLGNAVNRDTLTAMLTFQSSFDALATNVMAFGASGDSSFRLTYSSQLIANAAFWDALQARRAALTPPQREHLDRIAAARSEMIAQALRVRTLLDGDHAYEDLYLYRTEVVPEADRLLDLLQQVTVRQQTQLQGDLARAREDLERSRTQTVIGGVLTLAIGLAMTVWLRRSIVGPVQRLTRVARRVADGDFQAKARPESADQIGMLAESFNTMTTRLADNITDLERAYAEAQQAKNAAEAASRAKSSFLANMSHELRTPLNAILGYAQLLRHGSGLSARQNAGLETIQRSGQHLLLLINDVLDLARIEAGKLEFHVDAIDLAELLRTVTDIVRPEAQRKALQFDFEAAADVPTFVRADERRLRQVLLNLLNNAVKFTVRGRVCLRVTTVDLDAKRARLSFSVEDTGPGIDPEQLARLFRPFEQAADVQRRFGGTGLGLAISRQLLTLAGSDIRVESVPGEGSRFWFEIDLPLAPGRTSPPPSTTTGIAGYEGARRLVLVVDDIASNRAPVVQFLGRLGFETLEAENGSEALRAAELSSPDLVLLDSEMPGMSGEEVIRRVRVVERLRRLPIVVVSANASAEDRERSIAAGADAFLPKPLDFGALLGEMARALDLRWLRDGAAPVAGAWRLPPAAELDAWLHLARAGHLGRLLVRAQALAKRDPDRGPFVGRLRSLAEADDAAGIVELLVSARADAGEEAPQDVRTD